MGLHLADEIDFQPPKHPHSIALRCLPRSSKDSLQTIAGHVQQETAHIDRLIANAGKAGPGLSGRTPRATPAECARSAWSTSTQDFNATYQLNCTATYYTMLAFLELLGPGNKLRRCVNQSGGPRPSSQVIVFQRGHRYGFA